MRLQRRCADFTSYIFTKQLVIIKPSVFRSSADQLGKILSTTFKISDNPVHLLWKISSIVGVPKKKSCTLCVALTSAVMNVFEKLVLRKFTSSSSELFRSSTVCLQK